MNMERAFCNFSVLIVFLICFHKVELSKQYSLRESSCILPPSWSGIWQNQQEPHNSNPAPIRFASSSDNSFSGFYKPSADNTGVKNSIDATKFLSKGLCFDNKDERYFFYDKSKNCHRCLFIIQRHYNVLQYRETDCYDDISDFDKLCNLLAPDFPLYTMIRAEAVAEKCPLQDKYTVLSEFSDKEPYLNANAYEKSIRKLPETNNKCLKRIESNVISECSDRTMLRLDFQECVKKFHTNNEHLHHKRHNHAFSNHHHHQHRDHFFNHQKQPQAQKQIQRNGEDRGMVAKCIAHWTEGNWNYLIIKQDHLNGFVRKKQNFRCAVYQDLDRPFKNTQSNNIINPANNLIRFSLSDDELCRDFYANSNNFILKKRNIVSSNEETARIMAANQETCSFPKTLNKKWKNLRETKYAFNQHQNTLQIMHLNNSTRHHHKFSHDDNIYLKLNCQRELANEARYPNESVFLVSDLLECSSINKCLSISQKSDFILHLRYGYYNRNQCLFDEEHLIYEDYLFIETDAGIDCPFSDRVYQLSDDSGEVNQYESNKLKRTVIDNNSQFNIIYGDRGTRSSVSSSAPDSNCEHYLKIGCSNNLNLFNEYSINKKCQYSFNEQNNKVHNTAKLLKKKDLLEQYKYEKLPQYQALTDDQVLPVIESESNRICLAYWPIGDVKESPTIGFRQGFSFSKYVNNQRDQALSYIVLSKSRNSAGFSVTCSLWESYQADKKLKITDDYISEFCRNNHHREHKEHHRQTNAYFQRQRNINSNEFAIYESNPLNLKLTGEKSFVFDYKGTCGSNNSSNRNAEVTHLLGIFTFFLLFHKFL